MRVPRQAPRVVVPARISGATLPCRVEDAVVAAIPAGGLLRAKYSAADRHPNVRDNETRHCASGLRRAVYVEQAS